MVYIDSWDEFVERSVQIFRSDPQSTRYVMKYRHCDGKLVLKVTDNRECLKFKTDQAQDAKKMEKLNNIFFTLMTRGPDADVTEVSGRNRQSPSHQKREGEETVTLRIPELFWFLCRLMKGLERWLLVFCWLLAVLFSLV